jgi:flagellar basal body-associated protein FliL
MTPYLLFLDVTPDPVSSGTSAVVLILIGVVALLITAAAVFAFVFLLRYLLRAKTPAASKVTSEFQPSNPNQP